MRKVWDICIRCQPLLFFVCFSFVLFQNLHQTYICAHKRSSQETPNWNVFENIMRIVILMCIYRFESLVIEQGPYFSPNTLQYAICIYMCICCKLGIYVLHSMNDFGKQMKFASFYNTHFDRTIAFVPVCCKIFLV